MQEVISKIEQLEHQAHQPDSKLTDLQSLLDEKITKLESGQETLFRQMSLLQTEVKESDPVTKYDLNQLNTRVNELENRPVTHAPAHSQADDSLDQRL